MVDSVGKSSLLPPLSTGIGGSVSDGQGSSGPSFMDVLKESAAAGFDTIHAGEAAAAKAVTGGASLPEIVRAVNAAEMTLSTVVAIRDKLVGAYSGIMRMQM